MADWLGAFLGGLGAVPVWVLAPMVVTHACQCAFMLPVASTPNAIAFSTGELKISHMVKAGLWMNVVGLILVSSLALFVLPVILR
ncbi:anion permease [Auritidibacter ignavus]|uniref:anion permease n=1 Tax=Auritidibacter ignavus TaxID=678932 RepID=UPI00109C50AD|nr:anion permease [Auritidibacter ignavus]